MDPQNYPYAIVQTVREPMLLLGADLRVKLTNAAFQRAFGVGPQDSQGRLIYELGNGQWDIPALRKLLEEILPRNSHFDDFEVTHDFPEIGPRTMLLNARRLTSDGQQSELILLAIEDVTERQRLERENAGQRKWLQTTLASIGDAVITTDAYARVTFLNPTAERMTGWTAGNAKGQPLHEVFNIVNEETRKLVESPVNKAIRMGAVVGLANHTILIGKDGVERPIDDSAAPIRDDDGKIMGVVMVFHDITERRAGERKLAESEADRHLALDSAELGTWHLDPETLQLRTDRRFQEIFGGLANSLNYASAVGTIHPDDQLRVQAAVDAATRPENPDAYDTQYRVVHPGGSVRWVSAKGRSNFSAGTDADPSRKLVSFDGTIADITDRKLAETRLENSEKRYRRLFEAAHDGILILGLHDRRITDVNPFMLELLDYPRDHFIGKQLWEIGVFHDKDESQAAMDGLRENGSIRFEDRPLLDRNGRRRSVEIVANVYQEDHHPVIQCNIRDISERKRFENEREAHLINEQSLRLEAEGANRAKDMFLATLSHEMRTPLNAIVGWMSILRGGKNAGKLDEDDLSEGLAVIERNTKAQVQLIEDVLDVSRIVRQIREFILITWRG